MKTIIAGLLASTAVLRMMSDEGAGGTAAATDRQMAIADAVSKLDDADDSHWLDDGRPRMEAVEAIFGDTTPTREEVDAIGRVRQTPGTDSDLPVPASTEPDPNPPPAPDLSPVIDPPAPAPEPAPQPEPRPAASVTPCRIVMLTFDASRPFDGDVHCPGLVLKVADNGSINVKAFAPNGGADVTFTGVRHIDDALAMPDGADKNAAMSCTWEWPAQA